jgi:hypothetical protein
VASAAAVFVNDPGELQPTGAGEGAKIASALIDVARPRRLIWKLAECEGDGAFQIIIGATLNLRCSDFRIIRSFCSSVYLLGSAWMSMARRR